MATYYCEIIAEVLYSDTNGWPSDNAGTRASRASLNAVVSAASTDDTLILSGGTYILGGTFNVSKRLTVRSAQYTDINYYSHNSTVLIDANSGAFDALSGSVAGSVFTGFSVGGTSIAANYYSIAAGAVCTYNNITLFGSKRAVRFGASSIWNNCNFSHNKAGSSFLFYLVSGSPALNNCTFNDIHQFVSNGGGSVTLNNPLITGVRYGIINDGTTDITLNNPIILSSGYYSNSAYSLQTTSTGKIYVNYGCWHPNPAVPANTYSGNVIISNSISEQQLFLSGRRPAVVTFGVDDKGNLAYFRDVVSPKLIANGWVGTCAIDTAALDASDWLIVSALAAQGHDIAAHGRKLGNNIPDMNGITVTYSGAAPSATVTISGNALTISSPSGVVVGAFDLTNTSYDRLTEIVSAINSVSGFTAVKTNTDSSNGFSPYLKDCTAVNVKSTIVSFDYDPAKVWAGELTQSKADIENNIPGYVCTSFVCPGNATSTAMQAALLSAGFTGSRGAPPPVPLLGFSSINIFNLPTSNIGTYLGSATPTTSAVKARVGAVIEHLKWLGGMLCFYAHTTSELSDAGWQAVIDEVKKSGVMVLSNRDAVLYIKSQCVDSGDHMAYTKSNWVDGGDYHLQPSSPCIGAGTDVSLTTDIEGSVVPGAVGYDIGPYSYRPDCKVFDGSFPSVPTGQALNLPAQANAPTLDALGNALGYPGRAKYSITPVASKCATLASGDSIAVTTTAGVSITAGSAYLNGGAATVTIGTNSITRLTNGTLFNLRITVGARTITFPCNEGAGTSLLGYDDLGNVYTGAITSSNLTAFWSGTQDTYHHGVQYGYRLSGSTQIPANPYTGLACDGNTLTALPGFNASATYKMPTADQVFDALGTPFWYANNGSDPIAKTYAEITSWAGLNQYSILWDDNKLAVYKENLVFFTRVPNSADNVWDHETIIESDMWIGGFIMPLNCHDILGNGFWFTNSTTPIVRNGYEILAELPDAINWQFSLTKGLSVYALGTSLAVINKARKYHGLSLIVE